MQITLLFHGQDALASLEKAVQSLRDDQRNPQVSSKGLLVNFLDLEGGARKGPLEETVDLQKFLDAFGDKTGETIWQALQVKAWISPERGGLAGRVKRAVQYGSSHFNGPLAPFADEKLKAGIMRILDARAVLCGFWRQCEPDRRTGEIYWRTVKPRHQGHAAGCPAQG